MRILIKGGHVIDPANDIDKVQDLYIAQGKILSRGRKPQDFQADRVIDATDLVVCPGLVDMRARLREPGQENKATIASETKAAAKAGITTVCCPPDTDPVIDTPAVVELIHRRAVEAASAKVVTLGALTYRLRGEQLAEMSALKQAGCVGVSNALKPVNPKILRRAMEYAASQNLTVYLHPEDPALSEDGCAHEGTVSVRLGLPGIPETAETVAVAQALQLIDLTGVDAHFCQLSSAAAARMIARAQYDGAPITVDVAAHHLFLTEMDIGFFNPQCHIRPPLRTQRDRDGLREALVNGTISAICSDHQPHDTAAKLAPFPATEPGISALETLLPLALRLVDEGLLSLSDAISRVTFLPANILDINAGTLDVGASADICIFHPHYCWRYEPHHIVSAGNNTPFIGWNFKGFVTHTLVDGVLVHEVEEAALQEVITQGAYDAEQSKHTIAAVEAHAAAEEDTGLDTWEDDYEQDWLAEEPPHTATAVQPESKCDEVTTKSTVNKKTEVKTKVTRSKSSPESGASQDPLQREPAAPQTIEPAEQPEASSSAPLSASDNKTKQETMTGDNDAYKPGISQFKVPPKQFAPLSERLIKDKSGTPEQSNSDDD